MASFVGRHAVKSRCTTLSTILRFNTVHRSCLYQNRSFSRTRIVSRSSPACDHDEDFFGLKSNLGKSYTSGRELQTQESHYVNGRPLKHEDILRTVDPKSFEPNTSSAERDVTLKNLPYGFIRYDSHYHDAANEKQISEKVTQKMKLRTSKNGTRNDDAVFDEAFTELQKKNEISVFSDVTYTSEVLANEAEQTDVMCKIDMQRVSIEDPIDLAQNRETASEGQSVASDLGYIDEHFFQYDSQDSDLNQQNNAVVNSVHVNIDKTELPFIDRQYFEQNMELKESKPKDDVKPTENLNSEIFSEPSPSHVQSEGVHRSYVNDYFDKSRKPKMNFIDEQYFDPTFHSQTMKQSVSSAEGPGHPLKVDTVKELNAINDHTTDFTDEIFKKAKDFRQVKRVIQKFQKEKEKSESYEGKAYSVVQDLRESKSPITAFGKPKYTLDSQGFRILKDQVPQFEFASSLDIVQLLRKSILYNENDIIALNKPYGLESHGGPGVRCSIGHLLNDIVPSTKLHLVHRLDKETTGVMLLAKSADMAHQLQQLFYKREVKKRYLVITKGFPSSPKGLIDIPITEGKVDDKYRMTLRPYRSPELNPLLKSSQEGKEAKTVYRVLDTNNMTSLIECIGLTGLKHQIRVHLSLGLNCPILGDHKYAHVNKIAPMQLHPQTLQRLKVQQSKVRYVPMHLHARSVMMQDFLDGKHLFISAPLPNYFVNNMRSLRLKLPPRF